MLIKVKAAKRAGPRPGRARVREWTLTPGVEVLRDGIGREAVRFTTASGVTASIDTSVSTRTLRAFARALRNRLAHR